jgi:hypothetical protein
MQFNNILFKIIMLNDEQKLSFLDKINTKLIENQLMTSYEYEIFKQIKIEQNDNNKSIYENNFKRQKIENKLNLEKIETLIKNILSYINDKKEYEFISDFFINEYDSSTNNSSMDIIEHKESFLSENGINNNLNDFENINENFINLFSEANLTDINSIIKFNEKLNKKGKSKSQEIPSLNFKKPLGIKEEDILFTGYEKAKSYNNKNSNESFYSKEEMDKEVEEEMNRQIFGMTKKMKESARSLGANLKKDNQTLSNIENLQDKVNDKTTNETKRLKEFNYTLRFDFCKKFFTIIAVFGIFFATLFFIKLTPKLV